MTAIAKQLDEKLKMWRPSTARKVERLVANIINLAEREASPKTTQRRPKPANRDAFLDDKRVFRGRTPKDLAANHDDYLYGKK